MKKKLLALVAVLTLVVTSVFGLTACGGQKDTRPVVTVGYTMNKPMNYKDSNGKLVGFDTELAEKVFNNLGYRVVFKKITWSNKYVDLNSGNIDCVWNGFTCNSTDDGKQRSEIVDFSYKYMMNKQVVVVNKNSALKDAKNLDAFAGKKGMYENGSSGADWIPEFNGANTNGLEAQIDALIELKAGSCEFAVVDKLLADAQCGKGEFADLTVVEGVKALSPDEFYAVGFKKGSELTAKVNAELEKLAKDEELQKISDKYGITPSLVTNFDEQKLNK